MSVKVEHLSSRGEELGLFASVAGALAAVGMAVTCHITLRNYRIRLLPGERDATRSSG